MLLTAELTDYYPQVARVTTEFVLEILAPLDPWVPPPPPTPSEPEKTSEIPVIEEPEP